MRCVKNKVMTTRSIKIIIVFLATITLCYECCNPAKEQERFINPDKMLYTGFEDKRIHGPVHGNYEEYSRVLFYHYRIEGHDFTRIRNLASYEEFLYHNPSCAGCKAEKEAFKQELLTAVRNIVDSLNYGADYVTKTQIERLLNRQEENIVKRFDEILDSWD